MRLDVVGGPADGATVAAAPGPWRWIDGERERGHSRPRAGTGLYRRAGRQWMFMGLSAWRCRCGVVTVKIDRCGWCGAPRAETTEEAVR